MVQELCSCSTPCGILVPQPGIEPAFPALEGGIQPGFSHGVLCIEVKQAGDNIWP